MPKLELDQAFESKEEIAHSVKGHLALEMENFGYEIVQVDKNPPSFFYILLSRITFIGY
jgi:hypothetical protein